MSPGLTAEPSPAPCAARQLNAFTVDVEDYFHVAALSAVITRDSWATREYRVEANTERLLALLAERQVRGTFFVLGWVAGRSPGLATHRARRSRDRLSRLLAPTGLPAIPAGVSPGDHARQAVPRRHHRAGGA